jgi:hypothetical protein
MRPVLRHLERYLCCQKVPSGGEGLNPWTNPHPKLDSERPQRASPFGADHALMQGIT